MKKQHHILLGLLALAVPAASFAADSHSRASEAKDYVLTRVGVEYEPRPFPTKKVNRCKIIDDKLVEVGVDIAGTQTLKWHTADVIGLRGLINGVQGTLQAPDFNNYDSYTNYWLEDRKTGKGALLRSVLHPKAGGATEVRQEESDAAKALVMYLTANCKFDL